MNLKESSNLKSVAEKVQQALTLLQEIESGKIVATVLVAPSEVCCGDVTYSLSDGGTLVVFDDDGCWDYIDRVVFSDGEELSFDEMYERNEEGLLLYEEVVNYRPGSFALKNIYNWPAQ